MAIDPGYDQRTRRKTFEQKQSGLSLALLGSVGSTLNAGQNLSITATGKNNAAQSGDIAISGSQLKAGKNLTLDAARDITLHSAQNSESTSGTNSSKGGNVGVGIGAGTGGYGISVSAGVNAGKGHENGSGLTHSETTLDAGSHLSLSSGRDTTLKGAQASGEKITVDAGRNLTLESERDSDRYNAKQQNASAGGSFTLGSMTGSASVSASRDRLKSNFDSVKEQTGLFAGKGGYDVTVKEHTQLDGAVIASTAESDKNRLDTGTLGWSDIHNQADYRATHSSGSLSTGGPVGRDLLTNMAGGMLSGANNSGHAEGTTKAGVSEGALLIRDQDGQQQDVTTLNRDTDHANDGSISPIFNKEKEQNRLRQAQLIGEIAGQAMDVIRTQGDIAGLKAQTDPAALAQAREQLKKDDKPFRESDVLQRAYNNAMQQYGTGSDLQKAAQAVTGALTALAGNNLAGALASGASPFLATEIKKLTTNPLTGKVDVTSNAMAHAVLGAVTAQLNNQSAVAGGLGAGGGELAARYIAGQLFPGKTAEQLSESEKQQVSALSQLAAGLAGGLASGDTGGAVAAAQAGKNAVENNALGCAGSSNPYCVGKNDLLTTGGGGPGPVAGGVGAAGALATDGDKDGAGQPNVGKDLTDEQNKKLGGTGSGTPGGWGPEDEERARNNKSASQQDKINAAKDRYPKKYDQYNKLPDKNLEKAISKHNKKIAEHQGYLNDPIKRQEHVPDWKNLSPKHQENLLHHWQQDVNRHEAYKAIAEDILKGRK